MKLRKISLIMKNQNIELEVNEPFNLDKQWIVSNINVLPDYVIIVKFCRDINPTVTKSMVFHGYKWMGELM